MGEPVIFAFTGFKRAGKDTCANYLVDRYNFKRYAFADAMKEIAKIIFKWTDNHVNGDLKEVIDESWGISPRRFLQYFGTELMQLRLGELSPKFESTTGRRVWVKGFVEHYKQEVREGSSRNIVISDLRFPHEKQELEMSLPEVKKVYIRVDRGGVKSDLHVSELSILDIDTDYEIKNNMDISDLYKKLDKIIIQEGQSNGHKQKD